MNTFTPFIIMASDDKDFENDLKKYKLEYNKAVGSYEHLDGTVIEEDSYILWGYTNEKLIALMARQHNQEFILMVDSNRKAALIFNDGTIKALPGKFREISVEQADKIKNFTYVNNKFYGVL